MPEGSCAGVDTNECVCCPLSPCVYRHERRQWTEQYLTKSAVLRNTDKKRVRPLDRFMAGERGGGREGERGGSRRTDNDENRGGRKEAKEGWREEWPQLLLPLLLLLLLPLLNCCYFHFCCCYFHFCCCTSASSRVPWGGRADLHSNVEVVEGVLHFDTAHGPPPPPRGQGLAEGRVHMHACMCMYVCMYVGVEAQNWTNVCGLGPLLSLALNITQVE